ncbi:SAG-related sequence protein SRS22I, partial [Toxoplasma gondii TgCatPRC2]
ILPSEEHELHVNCTEATESKRQGGSTKKACKVTFNIASSAVRAGLAMSAVVGVIASLLQFA